MGVAENIDALLVKYDITQEALARIAKVAKSSVSHWRLDGTVPRAEAVQNICDYFRLTPDDILSDRYGLAAKEHGRFGLPVSSGERATVSLVTLGSVHAGPFSDEGEIERTVEVPSSVLEHHPHAHALIVEGDCMDRFVLPGMAVVYDPDLWPRNGSVAIVETEDYEAVMRRWYMGGDTLLLAADSHERHEDIVLKVEDGPVKVLGVVVWVQSAEEMS